MVCSLSVDRYFYRHSLFNVLSAIVLVLLHYRDSVVATTSRERHVQSKTIIYDLFSGIIATDQNYLYAAVDLDSLIKTPKSQLHSVPTVHYSS